MLALRHDDNKKRKVSPLQLLGSVWRLYAACGELDHRLLFAAAVIDRSTYVRCSLCNRLDDEVILGVRLAACCLHPWSSTSEHCCLSVAETGRRRRRPCSYIPTAAAPLSLELAWAARRHDTLSQFEFQTLLCAPCDLGMQAPSVNAEVEIGYILAWMSVDFSIWVHLHAASCLIRSSLPCGACDCATLVYSAITGKPYISLRLWLPGAVVHRLGSVVTFCGSARVSAAPASFGSCVLAESKATTMQQY
jgi:hypothetical protein